MVSKMCRWDGNVCFKDSCDSIDGMGNVHVCLRHRNFHGRYRLRVVAESFK